MRWFCHFVSLNFMRCCKYSKRSGPFMSLSVIGRTASHPFLRVLSVFRKTTPGDGAGAAASAPHTLWGVTPSAGWTVHQKQTGGFEGREGVEHLYFHQQSKLTDFAILWKCSASFCRPVWKETFQNKVSPSSRSLILRKCRQWKGESMLILSSRTVARRPNEGLTLRQMRDR